MRDAEGTLPPGALEPIGAALARETGYSSITCHRALKTPIVVPMTHEL